MVSIVESSTKYRKLKDKAMHNIREKYPGTHAMDVSDDNIIEDGGLTPKEKKEFKKLGKFLSEAWINSGQSVLAYD